MAGEHNKKHPEDPRDKPLGTLGAADPKYPWVGGTVDILGREDIHYADPDKPYEAFHKVLNHSGSSTITETAQNPKDALTNEFMYHKRSYAASGSSSYHEGHGEQASLVSTSSSVAQHTGMQSGGNMYQGAGKLSISASQGGTSGCTTAGDGYTSSNGDDYNEHVGNKSNNTEGNVVDTICGDKCTVISKGSNDTSGSGQYLINVQDGNMDTQVDGGKYRVKAGNDITIDSTTKITLVVGGSSIVIEPSKITITSAAVEFVKG